MPKLIRYNYSPVYKDEKKEIGVICTDCGCSLYYNKDTINIGNNICICPICKHKNIFFTKKGNKEN